MTGPVMGTFFKGKEYATYERLEGATSSVSGGGDQRTKEDNY